MAILEVPVESPDDGIGEIKSTFAVTDTGCPNAAGIWHACQVEQAPFVERAIRPIPVLLFGVTTLRVTCNDTWARRKALKSRQRAILVDLEGRTPHQRQYFRKFRHFDTTGACTNVATLSPAHAVGHAGR